MSVTSKTFLLATHHSFVLFPDASVNLDAFKSLSCECDNYQISRSYVGNIGIQSKVYNWYRTRSEIKMRRPSIVDVHDFQKIQVKYSTVASKYSVSVKSFDHLFQACATSIYSRLE